RFAGAERRSYSDIHYHHLVCIAVEQLAAAMRPYGFRATVARNLPLSTGPLERPHVDFITARFVRDIGYPVPIGGELRSTLIEWRSQPRFRLAVVAMHRKHPNIPPRPRRYSSKCKKGAVSRP